MSDTMKRGHVFWFNDSKGYGFLMMDDYKEKIFVHYTAIVGEGFKTLSEGMQVDFELIESPKGPQAANVRKRLDLPLIVENPELIE